MEKILVDTHRAGVIETHKKTFEFYSFLYDVGSVYPEHYSPRYEEKYEPEITITRVDILKQNRRELIKSGNFRKDPIPDTNDKWWRKGTYHTKKEPAGRKQQMSRYQIDTKYLGLEISKPSIICEHHLNEDEGFYKDQKSWKKNKKVRKQWMKKSGDKTGSIKAWDFEVWDTPYNKMTPYYTEIPLEYHWDNFWENPYDEEETNFYRLYKDEIYLELYTPPVYDMDYQDKAYTHTIPYKYQTDIPKANFIDYTIPEQKLPTKFNNLKWCNTCKEMLPSNDFATSGQCKECELVEMEMDMERLEVEGEIEICKECGCTVCMNETIMGMCEDCYFNFEYCQNERELEWLLDA